eukprot:Tbor_TRINITY_DN5555_c3_g1::TRINITY_DN5555_c3_g1_i1::g.13288::m.13288
MSTQPVVEHEFVSLQWRLDVPICSRNCPRPAKSNAAPPHFTLALDTRPITSCTTGTPITSTDESDDTVKHSDAVVMNGNALQRVMLSCDYYTAVSVLKSLEEACGALRSSQYSRVKQLVK